MGCIKGQADFNVNWYSVYEIKDNDEVPYYTGSARDICDLLDITKSCVCRAVKEGRIVRRRYKIYYDGKAEENY